MHNVQLSMWYKYVIDFYYLKKNASFVGREPISFKYSRVVLKTVAVTARPRTITSLLMDHNVYKHFIDRFKLSFLFSFYLFF